MSYEEKILAMLERMDQRLEHLETDVSDLKVGQAKLEADVLEIKAGQVKLQEDMDEVQMNVKYIWEEVDSTRDQIRKHDTIIQAKIM